MAKRTYEDFLNFVSNNQNLLSNRSNLISQYRASGGKIRKQTGLELITKNFGLPVKKSKTVKPKKSYIKMNHKKVKHLSSNSMVEKLKSTIETMYGYTGNTFIKVALKIEGDDYSQKHNFQVFIPYNKKNSQGVKSTGKKILENLTTYYEKLVSLYGEKENEVNDILQGLQGLKSDLRKSTYMTETDLIDLFAEHSIEIGEIGIVEFH